MTSKPTAAHTGRGVAVVASAFIIQALIFGIASSFGLYNIEFLQTFERSYTATSLVGTINLGLFMGAGPIASGLMSKWSHRQVAIFGALLSSAGLTCMPFAPNLESMYVFYGVLTGIGYNFLYMTTLIISVIYFPKRGSLSTGIVAAGAGVGNAVFPVIVYSLIDRYGWRGSMFILAGINLNVVVLAALLKPLDVTKQLEVHVDSPSDRLPINNGNENTGTIFAIDLGDERVILNDSKEVSEQLDETKDDTGKSNEGHRSKLKGPALIICKSVWRRNAVYFAIYCVNSLLRYAAMGIARIFIPEYMLSKGLSKEDGSLGLVVLGVGMFLGSLSSGALGNTNWCDRIKMCTFWNFALATCFFLFLIPNLQTYTGLLILILATGSCAGAVTGLMVTITTDIMGQKVTCIAFGIVVFANGIGSSSGPLITSALMDAFGNSTLIVYTCGIYAAIGGFLLMTVPLHQTLTRQRKNKRLDVITSLGQT